MFDVQKLAFAAAEFATEQGRWPQAEELFAHDASLARRDIWKHDFRFDATDERFLVESAGVDGAFDTCDDVRSDPMRAIGTNGQR